MSGKIASPKRSHTPRRWREGSSSMEMERPEANEDVELTPDQCTDEIIKQAEAARVKVFPNTGESFQFIAKIDQDYQLVGSHLDEHTKIKIQKGEYVDFGKLIPKDRILAEEDERLELVVRQGRTFWSLVSESVTINCYNRWEQAFRIFSDIYTRSHPHRSSELIQYNHIIHSISSSYVWENVYDYDKEFRLHLSKHPEWSWSVILQQAWSMRLRDWIRGAFANYNSSPANSNHCHSGAGSGSNNNGNRVKINEPCRQFNKGFCKFGASCKYEHRCSYCHKFGHMILNCRKLIADREKKSKSVDNKSVGVASPTAQK